MIIGFLCLIAGCGGGGGGGPVTPSDEITQVGTYDEIPDDFSLIYDFRDQNAQPPYRLVLTFLKSGSINYEKYVVSGSGFTSDTEDSLLIPNDVLLLYNYMVSKGFFALENLYMTPDQSKPITNIDITTKSKEMMVEYHPCQDCTVDDLPPVFNEITAYILNMAAKYLDKM